MKVMLKEIKLKRGGYYYNVKEKILYHNSISNYYS